MGTYDVVVCMSRRAESLNGVVIFAFIASRVKQYQRPIPSCPIPSSRRATSYVNEDEHVHPVY